jgi:hypothetical protein
MLNIFNVIKQTVSFIPLFWVEELMCTKDHPEISGRKLTIFNTDWKNKLMKLERYVNSWHLSSKILDISLFFKGRTSWFGWEKTNTFFNVWAGSPYDHKWWAVSVFVWKGSL